jgi:hypothetical protein
MQQKYNCPDAGCRVEGSIPGLKRHLQKSHGMTRFDAHVAADMIQYNTTRRTPAPEFGVVEDDVSIKRKRRSSNADHEEIVATGVMTAHQAKAIADTQRLQEAETSLTKLFGPVGSHRGREFSLFSD